MRKLILFLILLMPLQVNADCFLNCFFYVGSVCINNECVPLVATPTPTPVPTASPTPVPTASPVPLIKQIWLIANNTITIFDCNTLDLSNLEIFLVRETPPPEAYYYSIIWSDMPNSGVFSARIDILNDYRFILHEGVVTKAQSRGLEFVWNYWRNPAFTDYFKSKTCSELKSEKVYFGYGISIKGDMSDYEGAAFTFK